MNLYSDVFPLLEKMLNDIESLTDEIIELREQLANNSVFPNSEIHSDLSCVYSDFKVWNDFVEAYYNGIDPLIEN